MKLKTCFADKLMFIVAKIQKMIHEKKVNFINFIFCVALGAALDNCLCLLLMFRSSMTWF